MANYNSLDNWGDQTRVSRKPNTEFQDTAPIYEYQKPSYSYFVLDSWSATKDFRCTGEGGGIIDPSSRPDRGYLYPRG